MTELRPDTWEMPSGRLGPENPLPPLHPRRSWEEAIPCDDSVSPDDRKYFGHGQVRSCLPYRIQSDYGRELRPTKFRTAVLENEFLRATFLLELGGRLWSLFDKRAGVDLLYVNPVFQPANLAIRNAWFSGGVEWNIGMMGHCALTCSPLFAARLTADDGSPVLRLYEWERVRRVPFQIDAWLPDGSQFLFLRMCIRNPHGREVPMYWWSNIAVPEADGARVIAPANRAFHFSQGRMITMIPVPVHEGYDASYPTNWPAAADCFYRVDDGRRPWITSVDRDGHGLVQTSTSLLRGRKSFRWGMGPGGRRWQDFLSHSGPPYIELQAGLARTQTECLPMPPRSTWAWIEAYGPLDLDPKVAHGSDWDAAVTAAERELERRLPAAQLEPQLAATAATADRPPDEILHLGSGWGALERLRCEKEGQAVFTPDALPFIDASLGPDQEPWLALLEDGTLPARPPSDPPAAPVVDPEWRSLLEAALARGHGDWHSWFQLGLMAYHAGQVDAAREAWEKSSAHEPTAWAWRNLAVLAAQADRLGEAADLYQRARRLLPQLAPLAVECCQMLLRAGRHAELMRLIAELPEPIRLLGRTRVLEARAALELGRFDVVERLFTEDFVIPDMREGEVSLSELWFRMHERRIAAAEGIPIDDALRARVRRECPPPPHLDFRMFAPGQGAKRERTGPVT